MLVPSLSMIVLAIIITAALMAINWFIWGFTYSASHAARRPLEPASASPNSPEGGGFRSAA